LSYVRAGGAPRPLYFALWIPLGGTASAMSAGSKSATAFVRLDGPFHFASQQVATPTRDGRLVRVEGTGRLNGRPGYSFVIEAPDDSGQQAAGTTMRVRITHADSNGSEHVDYDNRASATAQMSGVGGGAGLVKIARGWVKLSR